MVMLGCMTNEFRAFTDMLCLFSRMRKYERSV